MQTQPLIGGPGQVAPALFTAPTGYCDIYFDILINPK